MWLPCVGRALQRYRRTVGFIFQQFNLVTRLSVMDNVLAGRLGYHPTWKGMLGLYSPRDKDLAKAYIRQVGLEEKENTRVLFSFWWTTAACSHCQSHDPRASTHSGR